MKKQAIVHKELSRKQRLEINIQQIKNLAGTINKLYFETVLKKLTHITLK